MTNPLPHAPPVEFGQGIVGEWRGNATPGPGARNRSGEMVVVPRERIGDTGFQPVRAARHGDAFGFLKTSKAGALFSSPRRPHNCANDPRHGKRFESRLG